MSDLKARALDPALTPFEQLRTIMAILRSPDGCNWDRSQTHTTLLPYLIEEAYEVLETVESGDFPSLREELGDLLLQVVFHAQLAEEAGQFNLDDCVRTIVAKLIERHPHVFGEKKNLQPREVRDQWEKIKTSSGEKPSVLAGLPRTMPALTTAFRLGEKAAGVGFDWRNSTDALEKVREELGEVSVAISDSSPDRKARLSGEIGDLLFAVASVARLEGIDPETALRRGLNKFRERFGRLEAELTGGGRRFEDFNLEQMEEVWQRIKRESS